MRKSCLITASVLAAAMWGTTAVAVGQSTKPAFVPGGGADPLQSVVDEHLKVYRSLTGQTRLAEATSDARVVTDAGRQSLIREDDDRSIATLVEDAAITAAIKTRLVWDDPEQAFDVAVITRRGVVTLSGETESIHARVMAEDIAARTDGVLQVINEIEISEVAAFGNPGFTDVSNTPADAAGGIIKTGAEYVNEQTANVDGVIDDAWITAQVKAELVASDTVDGMAISVDTRGGMVSLHGEVPDVETKALAVRAANGVEGVIGVDAVGLKVRTSTASTS